LQSKNGEIGFPRKEGSDNSPRTEFARSALRNRARWQAFGRCVFSGSRERGGAIVRSSASLERCGGIIWNCLERPSRGGCAGATSRVGDLLCPHALTLPGRGARSSIWRLLSECCVPDRRALTSLYCDRTPRLCRPLAMMRPWLKFRPAQGHVMLEEYAKTFNLPKGEQCSQYPNCAKMPEMITDRRVDL
jgi:hypothetical protein